MPTTINVALAYARSAADAQGIHSRVQAWMTNPDFICIVSLFAIALVVSIALTVFVPLPDGAAVQLIQGP